MSQNNQGVIEDQIIGFEAKPEKFEEDVIEINQVIAEPVEDNVNKYIDINVIANLVYQEHINIDNANRILNNWEVIKKQLPENRLKTIDDTFKAYDPLFSLKKICKCKENINQVTYSPSKYLKYYGRLFAKSASLQGLPREIRGAIGTDYYDVDMKNAHPTILLQYCKVNDIKAVWLEKYVNNREEILKDIGSKLDYTRDETKELVLHILNGKKREGLIVEFLQQFQKECSNIHESVTVLNKDIKKEVSRRKTNDINVSVFNVVICKIENKCLLYAIQYLKSLQFNVDVLIFDGFMVRRDENNLLTDEILKNMSEYVNNKTGYSFEFVIKPLDSTLNLKDLPNTSVEQKLDVTYYADKQKFEENHIKITYPPMYVTTFEDRPCILQSQEDITKSFLQLKTNVKNVKEVTATGPAVLRTSFIKSWLNDEFLRKKDSITFKPPPIIEEHYEYNTWKDFEIKKIKLDAKFDINGNLYVKRFIEFVDNLLGNRLKYTNYLIALIANIIQNTGNRACVCIVLYSIIEGVGKSMLNDLINKLLGEDYCYDCTDPANGLFGKHSLAEFQKLYISLVETKGKDTYLNNEVFKTRITDARREYEPKGLKQFHSPNYCTYLCTTNNANCVPVSDKSRRFFIATCNNPKAGDKIYFKKFVDEVLNDKYAIRCIFEYLDKFDIESVVPNKLFQVCIPYDDPLYLDLVEYNKEIEICFLEHFVRIFSFEKSNFKISTRQLWTTFENFLENNGENKKSECITAKKFHFNFKQKVCQVLQNKEGLKDIISYSTRENRIRNNKDEECYLFNIPKLLKYLNITKAEFIAEDE